MSERCKQCETDLESVEFKKVAQWSFCVSCFDELMEASAKKKVATAADFMSKSDVPEAEPELTGDGADANSGLAMRFSVGPATLRCQTCKVELLENQGRSMLGTTFCANCYEVLVEGFSVGEKKRAAEPEPEPEPQVPQVKIDLTAQANCFACNKWIRKIAAKVRDDQMYCPDCFVTLPAEEQKAMSTSTCNACGEQAAELHATEGFSICGPCLSTDRDLAINLAREHHLAKMKQGV